MDPLLDGDQPYGDDWDDAATVARWTAEADEKRPWRRQIRDHLAARVAALPPGARILELGSGPGFLAEHVLARCPHVARDTLLDFSALMIARSRERLAGHPAAEFVHASFKTDDWTRQVTAPFDCVLSMQAVHELRHTRHAPRLYAQVREVLAAPGLILICDHTPFDDTPKSLAMYMPVDEQLRVLREAGFSGVQVELSFDSLVVYAGRTGG